MGQRHARRGWSAGVSVAAIALVSCATAPSVFIRQVLAPPVTGAVAGTACIYMPIAIGPQLSAGLVDAGLRDSYRAVLLAGSQIVSSASADQRRVEASQFLIEGAEVHVFDAKENELRSFTRLATATLEPALGIIASYATVEVDILDGESIREAAANLKARNETRRVVVDVVLFGHTLGGVAVESTAYRFPIDVCKGCLVSFEADTDDPTLPGPDCKGTPAEAAIVPCFIGQDQKVSCADCQGYGVCELG